MKPWQRYRVQLLRQNPRGEEITGIALHPDPDGDLFKVAECWEDRNNTRLELEELRRQNADLEVRNSQLFMAAQSWEQRAVPAERDANSLRSERAILDLRLEHLRDAETNNGFLRAKVEDLENRLRLANESLLLHSHRI